MASTVEQLSPDAEGEGRPSRLHVPALRQLYTRVSLHKTPESTAPATATATEPSLSSRPVVVRTYSPASACRRSRASASGSLSSAREPRHSACPSSSSVGSVMLTGPPPFLPPTTDFSFAGILHAVEPEISSDIDAIAAICARSKLCLADEYAAHRPPHEVLDPAIPIPLPGQSQYQRQRWWSAVRDTALAAVPEVSSSSSGSERLTGSRSASRASMSSNAAQSAKARKSSAYGSLKTFVSAGDGAERRRGLASLFGGFGGGDGPAAPSRRPPCSNDWTYAQWMVPDAGSGCIRLSSVSTARAVSPCVSLAVTEEPFAVHGASSCAPRTNAPTTQLVHSSSPLSIPPLHNHGRTVASPGWLSWGRSSSSSRHDRARNYAHQLPTGATVAEQQLKWLLEASDVRKARAKQCYHTTVPA